MYDIYEQMLPPYFWWKMFAFLGGSGIAIFIVNTILRKLLGVKRKPLFSYNHLNDFHKKADWSIRILAIIFIILGPIFAGESYQGYLLVIALVFGLAQEILTAVMEKKYADNPKDYLFTLIQIPIALIIVFSLAGGLFPGVLSDMLASVG